MKSKSGYFAKTLKIFYFLRTDNKNNSTVVVTGKEVNYGDGEGI